MEKIGQKHIEDNQGAFPDCSLMLTFEEGKLIFSTDSENLSVEEAIGILYFGIIALSRATQQNSTLQ